MSVARQEAVGDEADNTAPRGVGRILVVDDSAAHVTLMSNFLTRWKYDVVTASSAEEALQHLDRGGIDIVLSDWVMPGTTGLDLCRAVRGREGGTYVYFILLTSKTGHDDVATGLAAGADDFLSKPVNAQELRARMSAGERLLATQRALEDRNLQLAGALEELQKLYDGIARDLVEARRLQQSLVPERALRFPGAEVSLLLRPSGHVGGDLVGAFQVSETRVGVYSIDVSGHGIASALMTARLAGYLSGDSPDRNVALASDDHGRIVMRPLPEICSSLNATILADMETELYFTMTIADCDLETGRIRVAQAGHPYPLVQRSDGSAEFVGTGGMPIGLFDQAEYVDFEVVLAPGDRLLLHSDGFTEASTRAGEMLGDDGLERLVCRLKDERGESFLEALVWSLSDFAGSGDFDDDVSAAMIEFAGAASPGDA